MVFWRLRLISVLITTVVYIWLISYKKNESKPFFVWLFSILSFCFNLSNASTISDIVKLFAEINLKILSASGLLLHLGIDQRKFLKDELPFIFWIVFYFPVNLEDNDKWNLNKSAQFWQFHAMNSRISMHSVFKYLIFTWTWSHSIMFFNNPIFSQKNLPQIQNIFWRLDRHNNTLGMKSQLPVNKTQQKPVLKSISLVASHAKVPKLYFYKCAHFLLFLTLSTIFIYHFHSYTKIITLISLIATPNSPILSIPTLFPTFRPWFPAFPSFPPWLPPFPSFPSWFPAFQPWFRAFPSFPPWFSTFPSWFPLFPSFSLFRSPIPHYTVFTNR